MAAQTPESPRLVVLRLPEVCKMTGLCRSTIYEMEANERFPRRIKVGVRSVGWIDQEVQDWLARRLRCSRGTAQNASGR